MTEAGRVIAGSARGIRLLAPGPGTRPLSDRVKQALFAILEPDLPGSCFLDLFAGSGAAGIEALSRGVARAVFVERHAGAARVIRENLRRTGFAEERAQVIQAEGLAYLNGPAPERRFDVAVVDPPYAEHELLVASLQRLGSPQAGLLADDAVVVATHFWRDSTPDSAGLLASQRERRFGETALTFYRYRPQRAEEAVENVAEAAEGRPS